MEAEPPVESDVAPPRLVRGKTGLLKKRNHEWLTIAALVAEALPSWAGIDAEEIEVSMVRSDREGSSTCSKMFKVAAPPDEGFEPPVVALHLAAHINRGIVSEDVEVEDHDHVDDYDRSSAAARRRMAALRGRGPQPQHPH